MYGKIFNFIRIPLIRINFFKQLLGCAMCTGFWSGLCIGIISPYNPFLFALYSSFICLMFDYIAKVLEDILFMK